MNRPPARLLERTAFYGMLLTVAASALSFGAVNAWTGYLTGTLICVFGILRVIDGVLSRGPVVSETKAMLPLAGILLIALCQLIPFWDRGAAGDELFSLANSAITLDPVATRNFIVQFASFLICGEVLMNYATSRKRKVALTSVVLVIGVGSAVFGLARMIVLSEFPRLGSESGGFAQFSNRNHFAVLMEMTLGLAAGIIVFARSRTRLRLAMGVIAALGIMAAIFSQSRGGLFALLLIAVAALAIWINARRRRRYSKGQRQPRYSTRQRLLLTAAGIILIVISSIFLVAFIGGDALVTRFERLSGEIETSEQSGQVRRMDIWRSTVELIGTRPLSGVGFGAFPVAITPFDTSMGHFHLEHAHNEYLDLAANGGIMSVALLLVFFAIVIQRAKKAVKSPVELDAALSIGACLGIGAVMVHNLADFGLRSPVNALVFLVLIVMILTIGRPSKLNEQTVTVTPEAVSPTLGRTRASAWRTVYLLIAIVLFAANTSLSLSNIFSRRAASSGSVSDVDAAIQFDPVDRVALATRAQLSLTAGNAASALADYQRAIELCPADYRLWMEIASAFEIKGDQPRARRSFDRALELAPNYVKPKWEMGEFLLRMGDNGRAFDFLNQAADTDAELVARLIRAARLMGDDDIDSRIDLNSFKSRKRAAVYLIEYNIRSREMEAFLIGPELSDPDKQEFVRLLLDKKQIDVARNVWTSQVGNAEQVNSAPGPLLNGDFEIEPPTDDSGFGWRFETAAPGVRVYQNRKSPHQGRTSMEIEFSGNSNPATPLISQLIVLEPDQNYELRFVANVGGNFVSGGPPVVEIKDVLTGRLLGNKTIATESPDKWQRYSISFETPRNTNAVVLSVLRSTCRDPQCPAFGRIGFDDFAVAKE